MKLLNTIMEFIESKIACISVNRLQRDKQFVNPNSFSHTDYSNWRDSELLELWNGNFSDELIRGKQILDFGCGSGGLSFLMLDKGASSVTGIDLYAHDVDLAKNKCSERQLDGQAQFLVGEVNRIPLPEHSSDVVLCLAVLEHIMEYQDILAEWRRILKPGGKVLIWWVPWPHPYGHHLHTLIPLPWVHLFLPGASLYRICARIYNHPSYQPRFWHFDEDGKRRPNPYVGMSRAGDLNRLTTWKFERVCHAVGFRIDRKEVHPFTGSLRLLKRLLASLPYLNDAFCSAVIYELSKIDTN